MKKKFFLLIICGGLLLLSFGCRNIFRGSIENLDTLLDSGDWAAVITAAENILASDANNVDALKSLGTAQAAQEGFTTSELLLAFNDASDAGGTQNIDQIFSGIAPNASTSNLLEASQNLYKAEQLGNMSSDQLLNNALVYGGTAQMLHEEIWTVTNNTVTPLLPAGAPTNRYSLEYDVKGPDGNYLTPDSATSVLDSSVDALYAFNQAASESQAFDTDQMNQTNDLNELNQRKLGMQKAIDGVASASDTYNNSATTYVDNNGLVHDMTNITEAQLNALLVDAYYN